MKKTVVVLGLILCVTASGCVKKNNAVVEYLDGAELQYEGEQQKQNITEALNDVLLLSAEELLGKRYDDYQGNEDQWDLPSLIYHHFVPDESGKGLGPDF